MTGRFVIICISRRRGESSLLSYLQAFPHMMSHSLFYLFFVGGRKNGVPILLMSSNLISGGTKHFASENRCI